MEEKKLDTNSLIGFILIGAILIWMLFLNPPAPEPAATEEVQTEEAADAGEIIEKADVEEGFDGEDQRDSVRIAQAKSQLGAFGYSAGLP
ncbi:MAG TPA: membrane protein insertase YidC, partial [Salinimicrobium sp.]|nr:membrane protein insertase YidC [Salinimicrobium sp.]